MASPVNSALFGIWGSTPNDIYAVGVTGTILHYDGASWSALGAGTNGLVRALAVHDSGSGPTLFVGGDFTVAGGLSSANRVAEWTGGIWQRVSSGINSALGGSDAVEGEPQNA